MLRVDAHLTIITEKRKKEEKKKKKKKKSDIRPPVSGVITVTPTQLYFNSHLEEYFVELTKLVDICLISDRNDIRVGSEEVVSFRVSEPDWLQSNDNKKKKKKHSKHTKQVIVEFILLTEKSQQVYHQILQNIEKLSGGEKPMPHSERGRTSDSSVSNTGVMARPSSVLTQPHLVQELYNYFPEGCYNCNLDLLFSTNRDGTSWNTFLHAAKGHQKTLLLIKDQNGFAFGALATEQWHQDTTYYGTGESFLFSIYPEFCVYKWTEVNDYFQFVTETSFHMGGGTSKRELDDTHSNEAPTHYGLWIDTGFICGTSTTCDTYSNKSLSRDSVFQVSVFELWGFI